MGEAKTLKVKGMEHVQIYHAKIKKSKKVTVSSVRRHFCKHCASCLWISDPEWPDLVHPFASAIDTPLPKPPSHTNIMLEFAAPWCEIPKGKREHSFLRYPVESIEDWHRRNKLFTSV